MSKYIATRAIRGANAIVAEADAMLKKAIAEKGAETPVVFPNTAYFLPVTYGMLNHKVQTLGDLEFSLAHAKRLLHPIPENNLWVPYLGETLDSGQATLLATEAIEGIRFVYGEQPEPYPGLELAGSTDYPDFASQGGDGHLNGPIDDIQLRSWGIQLVDGRMPGFAAIIGAARTNEAAVSIVRELRKRNILIFLSGNVNGRCIIDQLREEGVEMGYDTYIVPFGTDTISAIYAAGFATRSALTFGGMKGGQWREILLYNKFRVFAFALVLGELDDLKYAAGAGVLSYGFPAIADTIVPEILPTGVTRYEHIVSMPWNEIDAETDEERAAKLVQRCIEVRGVKVKITEVPVPVAYGSAFEGEVVRRADMRIEFGGKHSRAFEYLRMVDMDEVEDHKIEVLGPGFEDVEVGGAMDLGILVEVAGRKMQEDFEPVLERQIHYFVNAASGLQHMGQRDITWIRISKTAADKGFNLHHFGDILYARLHADFGAIVDKVQVKIITDPELHAEWLEKARAAYEFRNQRLADLTDEAVDTFYDCTLCQSFAPTHVCIVSPQRLGLCGAYNWLDCKASYEINPTGPNQPVPKGECIDPVKGYFTGVNKTAVKNSQGTVQEVAMYSIMENPMTACGCFECIVMYIPEAEGVMVVSREDPSMTPAGMTFSTLAGMAGGGLQTPGVMGVGKFYLTSPRFISADGGFKRVVWMSSFLKESMAEELKAVAEREGVPDLIDRIADERRVTTVDELVDWLEEVKHPVLEMGVMQAASGAPEVAEAPPPAVEKPEAPPEVEEPEVEVEEAEELEPAVAEVKPAPPARPEPAPAPAVAVPELPEGADTEAIVQATAEVGLGSIRRA
ncbi:MAG: CO dehydrogenase/CO-methylating acetyl-CoA synthase complex subunit beta, partial [Chloroflexi bacterium]